MTGARSPRMLQVCAVDFTAVHLLRPLMLASRADGWSVEFACANGPGVVALRDDGFRYRPVPMSRSASPLALARAVAVLSASLRANPPDLIHTHTPVGGMVGRLAGAISGRSTMVHTFHGLPFVGGVPSTPIERSFMLVERLVARRTNYFFSQAVGDLDDAIRLGIADPRRALVIGNGVDVARFAPNARRRAEVRRTLQIEDDAVVVLFVGRLVREKGVLDLADAAIALAEVPSLHFLISGSQLASDRTGVESLLAAHSVNGILGKRWRRLGHRADVDALLTAADLFVLPTYREGLPRSIIEAMASGVPVLATRIRACEELVSEGETGLLVQPGDVTGLSKAIRSLSADAERRGLMGIRAREVALRRHDERAVFARQLRVLREFVAL